VPLPFSINITMKHFFLSPSFFFYKRCLFCSHCVVVVVFSKIE